MDEILHAVLVGDNCTCPRAACGGAMRDRTGSYCPDHDGACVNIWHRASDCPSDPEHRAAARLAERYCFLCDDYGHPPAVDCLPRDPRSMF
ncbi:hypothetical protein [Stackebrandtia nassauensis]|uniref:hypothetical protein n=1 Tax=Stackebrandtia nassauensis TaxID=283811 RepID=UPI0001A394EE|nr:hypothetical protein [Stackebrandtia nassauensis]